MCVNALHACASDMCGAMTSISRAGDTGADAKDYVCESMYRRWQGSGMKLKGRCAAHARPPPSGEGLPSGTSPESLGVRQTVCQGSSGANNRAPDLGRSGEGCSLSGSKVRERLASGDVPL